MKKVTYYCDMCGKEIKNITDEPCISIKINQLHSWELDSKAKLFKDINVCLSCGNLVNGFVNEHTRRNDNVC